MPGKPFLYAVACDPKNAIALFCFFLLPCAGFAQRSWDGGGDGVNWSDAGNWDNNAIPLLTENVSIGADFAVTIDGIFSCADLSLGSGTLAEISGANSLTINGALSITDIGGGTDAILNAGAGTISVAGAVTLGTAGQNSIEVSTGTITFLSPVTLANDADQDISFTGSGIINFNGGFTDNGSGAFVTFAGCTVNFGGSYSNSNNSMTWNAASNAVFSSGAPGIVPAAAIIFGNIKINAGVVVTLSGNIQIAGDWTNNGGTLIGGANTVTFESIGNTIGGTSTTTFPDLVLGNTLNNVNITLSQSITCSNFTIDADNSYRTFTHDVSNPSLTVTGNVTINQPTSNGRTNLWSINSGSASIAGNLIFSGSSNTPSRIAKVNVTSGSFILSGTVIWMAGQLAPQEVATEEITVSTGTITFSSSLTMGQGSGILRVTNSGTINFNGGTAPSCNLNGTVAGNTINAVFAALWGSTVNFAAGFTNANSALTLDDGSTAVFTGSGTITPTAAITFGNIRIDAVSTLVLAGNISVANNWTNLGGTFTPGTNTVTFNGTATQTISKTAATETFYSLASNTAGPVAFAATTDVLVTNTLTMISGNYNLNGRMLTLGNSAAATLVRTAGVIYGGTFRRWMPVASISSTAAPLYGLFPMGTETQYRPVEINSTVDPTSAGYVSNTHTDPLPTNFVTDVIYTDNESDAIERIANMIDAISTSGGFAGGTYNLNLTFTDLSATGSLIDLKMETYTGASMGSVGISLATAGTAASPVVKRSGLSAADLANDFVIATKNSDPLVTPIRPYYYSRKNGNWNDAATGDGTWSYTIGGAGPSCDCVPFSYGYAVVSPGQAVSVNVPASIEYADINTGATLNGTAAFTVTKDLTTAGSGNFAPTAGSWAISRNLTMAGTGSSSLSSNSFVTGNLNIGAGTLLTMNGGAGLTVTGNLVVNGTLALGTSTLTLDGTSGKTIAGSGGAANITGAGGVINVTTGNKAILAGTNLTIAPTFAIVGTITVSNNGTINLSGNLTGSVPGSTWANEGGSSLNAGGTILSTGTFDGSFIPNTVNYNGAGGQSIKIPSSTYYNLICSTSGTKTFATAGTISVTNLLTLQDAAVLDVAGNTLSGVAGLTMTGTSELRLATNITASPGLPQLTGVYTLAGGTIIFNRAGNQEIRTLNGPAPAAYYNVEFANSGTKSLSGPITIQNNLTISGSARLDVSTSNYDVTISGDWNVTSTNANPFAERNGTVLFNGIASQAVTTVLSAGESFFNLTINNIGTTGVTMNSAASVASSLILTDGLVFTTAANLLTMMAGSSVSSVSNNSFVSGPVAKTGSTDFTFPVGKEAKYRPILITSLSGSETFTAEYFHIDPNVVPYDVTLKDGTLNHISRAEYWTLNRAAAINALVTLSWDSYSGGMDNLTDIRVARWDGALWRDHGNGGTTGSVDPGTGTVITTALVSAFSPFTLASSSVSNPLPVELLNFEAKPNINIVDITWRTASEISSDYFSVERSADGANFEEAGRVEAAGNSSVINNYYAVDQEPLEGISYYRLKQTDMNGQYTYSQIEQIFFQQTGCDALIIYPNPATDKFQMRFQSPREGEILVVVLDILGNEQFSKIAVLSQTNNVIAVDTGKKLKPGMYAIVASSNDRIFREKVMIK